MFNYGVTFFVLALIASLLGFGGLAGLSAQIGWLCAVIAVIFLSEALLSDVRARRPGKIGEPLLHTTVVTRRA